MRRILTLCCRFASQNKLKLTKVKSILTKLNDEPRCKWVTCYQLTQYSKIQKVPWYLQKFLFRPGVGVVLQCWSWSKWRWPAISWHSSGPLDSEQQSAAVQQQTAAKLGHAAPQPAAGQTGDRQDQDQRQRQLLLLTFIRHSRLVNDTYCHRYLYSQTLMYFQNHFLTSSKSILLIVGQ